MSKNGIERTVATVIPNYNGGEELFACIESVLRDGGSDEIIVVDDGSTDGSGIAAAERFPQIRLIRYEENLGFAHAVNTGIRAAGSDYVFLLNNDARVTPGAVKTLKAAMENAGLRCFSVGAKMLTRTKPRKIDNSGDLYCVLGWAFSPGRDADEHWYSKRDTVTSACAGAALYRREDLMALGMFDEAHFCYLEDVDLGIRARLRGYRNLYEPGAVVLHTGSATSGSRHNAFKVKLTTGNSLYMAWKNFPAPVLVLLAPWLFCGILIKGVYFARKGLTGAYLEGLAEGVKKIGKGAKLREELVQKVRFPDLMRLFFEMFINLIRRFAG